jgi:hypothetical protein
MCYEQVRVESIITLYPPGAVREKWLRWVDELVRIHSEPSSGKRVL